MLASAALPLCTNQVSLEDKRGAATNTPVFVSNTTVQSGRIKLIIVKVVKRAQIISAAPTSPSLHRASEYNANVDRLIILDLVVAKEGEGEGRKRRRRGGERRFCYQVVSSHFWD